MDVVGTDVVFRKMLFRQPLDWYSGKFVDDSKKAWGTCLCLGLGIEDFVTKDRSGDPVPEWEFTLKWKMMERVLSDVEESGREESPARGEISTLLARLFLELQRQDSRKFFWDYLKTRLPKSTLFLQNEVGLDLLMLLCDSESAHRVSKESVRDVSEFCNADAVSNVKDKEVKAYLQHFLNYAKSANKSSNTVVSEGVIEFKRVEVKDLGEEAEGEYKRHSGREGGQERYVTKKKVLVKDSATASPRPSRIMVTGKLLGEQVGFFREQDASSERDGEEAEVEGSLSGPGNDGVVAASSDSDNEEEQEHPDSRLDELPTQSQVERMIKDSQTIPQAQPSSGIGDNIIAMEEGTSASKTILRRLHMEHFDKKSLEDSRSKSFATKQHRYRYAQSATVALDATNLDTLPITANYSMSTTAMLLAAKRGR